MEAAIVPKEFNKPFLDDYSNTNEYILLEPNEKKKYTVKINKTESSILIKANEIQNSNSLYKVELGLNAFYQLSKGFKMFDNLDDICEALNNILMSKKVSMIKKNYSLFIIFTINLIGGKEQEIKIELFIGDIEVIRNIKINQLENEIKEIKGDKNILLKKIKELEDIIKAQNNEIEKIKNWQNEYNTELQQMKLNKINDIFLNRIDSKIINKKEDLEFLEKRLKNNEILKKKNI